MSLSRPAPARALRAAPSQHAPSTAAATRLLGGVGLQRRVPGAGGVPQQRRDVDPGERGGDQPERRQRAVAPTDVRGRPRTPPGSGGWRPAPAGSCRGRSRPRSWPRRVRARRSGRTASWARSCPPTWRTPGTASASGRSRPGRRRSRPRRWSRARAGSAGLHASGRFGAAPPGASEEPPIPSTTTSSIPSAATSAANSSYSACSTSMRSAIVSQPRRLATSGVPGGPQMVASPLRRRSGICCWTSSATRSSTAERSGPGMLALTGWGASVTARS